VAKVHGRAGRDMQGTRGFGGRFSVLGHSDPVMRAFGQFAMALLEVDLPPRERELVVLRVAWNCASACEFGHHVPRARAAGLTDDDVARVATRVADGWGDDDGALLAMADELCADHGLSDDVWARLASRWSPAELVELLIVAGYSRMVSALMNAVGVQPEARVPGWPAGVEPSGPSARPRTTRPAQLRIEPSRALEGWETVGLLAALGHTAVSQAIPGFGAEMEDANLPRRSREVFIMRTAANCRCAYTFAHHAPWGRKAGLTDDDVVALARGSEAPAHWDEDDRTLVALADELCADDGVTDRTWARSAARWETDQLLELVVLSGFVRLNSTLVNATGVQLEEGYEAPAL
jgi:4-carboxymuconolactone decarboxylase